MLSLMWGTGWPALYSHEQLADITHRRGGDLYGATSMHYYRHVLKMVSAGQGGEVRPRRNRAYAGCRTTTSAYAAESRRRCCS